MSKTFYPTKQFNSLPEAIAYCRVHASSQDALDYLHRIGTESPDKHAALKAVVCALIDMGESDFAVRLISAYNDVDYRLIDKACIDRGCMAAQYPAPDAVKCHITPI